MVKNMAITESKTKSRRCEILEDGFILMYSGVPKTQKPKQEYDALYLNIIQVQLETEVC